MRDRIDSLTPEETATFESWVERWVQWGLSTEQLTDDEWDTVEHGARCSYRLAGLDEPKFVLRMSSPLGAALAPWYLAAMLDEHNQVWDRVGDQVGDRVMNAFDYGNFQAGFISWVEWFRQVGRLRLAGDNEYRADAYRDAHTAGPATWFANCFAASDRPAFIHRDGNGALHGVDGPAIGWRDGWSINCWHGTRVPDDFYTWDTSRGLTENNSEIRRCAIERIGWENLTDRLTLIAEAPDPGNAPHMLRLYGGDLLDGLFDEQARILVVENASLDKGGHRRTFGLPVPAGHSDPLTAAADLFEVPVAAYKSLARAS